MANDVIEAYYAKNVTNNSLVKKYGGKCQKRENVEFQDTTKMKRLPTNTKCRGLKIIKF